MKLNKEKLYIFKCKFLINLSLIFLVTATIFKYLALTTNTSIYNFNFLDINTKDIASVEVSMKNSSKLDTISNIELNVNALEINTNALEKKYTELNMPMVNNSRATILNRQVWYLPVEMGTVTSTPNYSHVALDITSPRGESEVIYPIANGEISGIYTDSAGAKIVTVRHFVNGTIYSSQYVHLSRYVNNLYVGKQVTINDALGYMGRTGIATGVHLHIALVDCDMFSSNDPNCSNLNGFFRYARVRLNQGFNGLYSVMNVPSSWNNR